MASIQKTQNGYRAFVAKNGIRKSRRFPTKREAKDWAARVEFEIANGEATAATMTFGELLGRYARERSPQKRGARWEIIRLEKLQRDKIASVKLENLSAKHFTEWREKRLREVAPASVIREMQLMSSVLNTAKSEWQLIPGNPLREVKRPKKPLPRDRLVTAEELDKLAESAGSDLKTATARAFHAFRFACETAMRAGEIVGLTWDRVDLDRRVAKLTHTKNGRPSDVPLSSEAIRLLKELPEMDPIFGLTSRQLDVLWRKVRDKAGVKDLTFHDSRHYAITRLSKKLDVLALARMVGHTDLKMLQVYYNEDAEELAKRLD